jgi:hypothetical protein
MICMADVGTAEGATPLRVTPESNTALVLSADDGTTADPRSQ